MKSRILLLVSLLAILLAACNGSGGTAIPAASATAAPPSVASPTPAGPATAAPAGELTIYGAASLSGALAKAKTAYEASNPGTTLTISTDSSAALEVKIEQGAPADVFLSADTKNPQTLIDKGFASGAPTIFAGNKLTIVVPTDNPAKITTPADIVKAGVKIVAAGDEVPITKYATMLVANLAKQPGYPTDFVTAYATNVVSKEDNVKALIAKIELGEGDAGIVYVTDAKASTKVATIGVPDAANVPAVYGGVVVKASTHADAAAAFLTWFAGPDGQAILASFGFLPPS
jgi:molybdate transport system substrate-binding protein